MNMSTINVSTSLKNAPPIQQKAVGTILSFFISLAIFIMIRVLGVIYFKETFIDIIDFSPISALNFMVWLGIMAVLIIGFVMLNFTISTEKEKLNMDVISAVVISIGVYWLISYNYIGYVYPSLLYNADIGQRLLNWAYYISIFAVYGSTDLFLFWLGISIIFHVTFFFFSSVDLEDKLFVLLEKLIMKQSRIKNSPTISELNKSLYGVRDFLAIDLISIFSLFLILYIPVSFFYPALSYTLYSLGGIILLIGTSMINTLFYVLSKRMKDRTREVIFFTIVSTAFTVINIFFIVARDWIVAIILILASVVIMEVISNAVIKH